jgi:hypothetical protein
MAKYKLLKEIIRYNYGAGNPPVQLSVKYIIPTGTIIEATPQKYGGAVDFDCVRFPTASPCTSQYKNNFYIVFNTKYGTENIQYDSGSRNTPSYNLVQVDESTPTTIDINIIPKDIKTTGITKSDTKYYNATVKKAKYSYKVGDAIKVQITANDCKQHQVGCASISITTLNKTDEKWFINSSLPSGTNKIGFIEELIVDEKEIPASEIEAKGGTAPTTETNHTVRNILYVALGLTVVYVLFFQKEAIFKLNK